MDFNIIELFKINDMVALNLFHSPPRGRWVKIIPPGKRWLSLNMETTIASI